MRNYSCIVIGDVNVDYVSDISHVLLHETINSCINSNIYSSTGGNGTFFAEAAVEAGFNPVKLLCSLGNDIAANTAKKYLNSKCIDLVNFPSKEETGKVLILYQPGDRRVLIADRGANKTLFISSECEENIVKESIDMLYISGYSIFNDIGKVSLKSIIYDYKSNGTYVIIDSVPHEIFEKYSWEDYSNYFSGTDGITIELETALGFMGKNSADIDSIADFLLNSFEFCLVRLNSQSDFLIADRSDRRTIRIKYQPRIASLRFTDRVIAQIMFRYLRNSNEIFFSSEWINDVNKIFGGL